MSSIEGRLVNKVYVCFGVIIFIFGDWFSLFYNDNVCFMGIDLVIFEGEKKK